MADANANTTSSRATWERPQVSRIEAAHAENAAGLTADALAGS